MRKLLLIHFLVIGFAIQVGAYFFLAAPWGFPPRDVSFSNPTVPFAPVVLIGGILVVFAGVLIYELLPERSHE
jgi:hypothetical protein